MKVETDDIKCILFIDQNRKSTARKGDFFWVDEYQAYIYRGRTFTPDEFNEENGKIVKDYQDLEPYGSVKSRIVFPKPKNRDNLAKARAVKAMKLQEEKKRLEAQKGLTTSDSTGTKGRHTAKGVD